MYLLRRPDEQAIQRFLAGQAGLDFTYPQVGATAGEPPRGFRIDHTRVELGSGEAVYEAAVEALKSWDQFRLPWMMTGPSRAAIKTGNLVAVIAKKCGFWWMNSCRIVYVTEVRGPVHRYGFAYGTLPGHMGRGEERFLVEWDRATDQVWYDILAFSQPRHVLCRVGYPLFRMSQKEFGRGSAAAMRRAVAAQLGLSTPTTRSQSRQLVGSV